VGGSGFFGDTGVLLVGGFSTDSDPSVDDDNHSGGFSHFWVAGFFDFGNLGGAFFGVLGFSGQFEGNSFLGNSTFNLFG